MTLPLCFFFTQVLVTTAILSPTLFDASVCSVEHSEDVILGPKSWLTI